MGRVQSFNHASQCSNKLSSRVVEAQSALPTQSIVVMFSKNVCLRYHYLLPNTKPMTLCEVLKPVAGT